MVSMWQGELNGGSVALVPSVRVFVSTPLSDFNIALWDVF